MHRISISCREIPNRISKRIQYHVFQAHLVARHIDTECKLSQQAQLLLTVADEATKDLQKVHDKLDRKR